MKEQQLNKFEEIQFCDGKKPECGKRRNICFTGEGMFTCAFYHVEKMRCLRKEGMRMRRAVKQCHNNQ